MRGVVIGARAPCRSAAGAVVHDAQEFALLPAAAVQPSVTLMRRPSASTKPPTSMASAVAWAERRECRPRCGTKSCPTSRCSASDDRTSAARRDRRRSAPSRQRRSATGQVTGPILRTSNCPSSLAGACICTVPRLLQPSPIVAVGQRCETARRLSQFGQALVVARPLRRWAARTLAAAFAVSAQTCHRDLLRQEGTGRQAPARRSRAAVSVSSPSPCADAWLTQALLFREPPCTLSRRFGNTRNRNFV